jgi:hypothetical protein
MLWPCRKEWKSRDCQKSPGDESTVTVKDVDRPRTRWKDKFKLDFGSRGEEWMTIQNENIWDDRARWKGLGLVIHSSGNA